MDNFTIMEIPTDIDTLDSLLDECLWTRATQLEKTRHDIPGGALYELHNQILGNVGTIKIRRTSPTLSQMSVQTVRHPGSSWTLTPEDIEALRAITDRDTHHKAISERQELRKSEAKALHQRRCEYLEESLLEVFTRLAEYQPWIAAWLRGERQQKPRLTAKQEKMLPLCRQFEAHDPDRTNKLKEEYAAELLGYPNTETDRKRAALKMYQFTQRFRKMGLM